MTGLGGLLMQPTEMVQETALNEEMTEHLGYAKLDPARQESGNLRTGTRAEMVLTKNVDQVEIKVPRYRSGMFEPQIVPKRQRRMNAGPVLAVGEGGIDNPAGL